MCVVGKLWTKSLRIYMHPVWSCRWKLRNFSSLFGVCSTVHKCSTFICRRFCGEKAIWKKKPFQIESRGFIIVKWQGKTRTRCKDWFAFGGIAKVGRGNRISLLSNAPVASLLFCLLCGEFSSSMWAHISTWEIHYWKSNKFSDPNNNI